MKPPPRFPPTKGNRATSLRQPVACALLVAGLSALLAGCVGAPVNRAVAGAAPASALVIVRAHSGFLTTSDVTPFTSATVAVEDLFPLRVKFLPVLPSVRQEWLAVTESAEARSR